MKNLDAGLGPTRTPDPVLTFDFIISDLGISRATFHRNLRHVLPVIAITERRRGVRQSDYETRVCGR